MKPITFIALLVLLDSATGLSAFALSSTEIRNEIQTQITQRHPTANDRFWHSLGGEAAPVVRQMYKESNDAQAKAFLIDGMGYFDDSETASFLKSQISATEDDILKKGMLGSLIQSQGDEVYDFVEPYLKDQDAHVRSRVAQGLRDHAHSARARKRLEEFSRQEKVAWVKDLQKKKPENDLMSVQKVGEDERQKVAAEKPAPTPMPEKAWVGEWKGAYITPKKNTAALLTLTLLNEKAKKDELKWKIELKVPKQVKQELREKDVEIVYYQTATTHWIEIRNKKDDSVLIGQRR